MTGREMIIYILKNNLEDEELSKCIFSDLLMTPEEAAAKWKCGPATVKTLIDLEKIKGVKFGTTYGVYINQENPFGKGEIL